VAGLQSSSMPNQIASDLALSSFAPVPNHNAKTKGAGKKNEDALKNLPCYWHIVRS